MIAGRLYDLLVVGGGINGAGIARDAAGRGLKVLLVEQDDLASHTSSASTKLIHGGLRYLEHGKFGLVRESLLERERLLRIAPHLIRPIDFVIPRHGTKRPAWMLRLGLFAYDHLGGRSSLPGTRTVSLDSQFGDGLSDRNGKAFVYSDACVDDSRLVVLNALDAARNGADIRTRTRFVGARREKGLWRAALEGPAGKHEVQARALVNAAGPWVGELAQALSAQPRSKVRLVKGSHIVVPRLFDGEHAFLIQNPDRRIVFAIPFEGEYTLIGTTESEWRGPPGAAAISASEIDYLLDTSNRTFLSRVGRGDVRWCYSGVRPLVDDGSGDPSSNTRGYVLELDAEGPPLLGIFGGKITTYRQLAERALGRLAPWFPQCGAAWTSGAFLPGGDLPNGYSVTLRQHYPFLDERVIGRLLRSYGTRAERILGDARSLEDLGTAFGAGLFKCEVDYLIAEEWARTADDILYRRSKLGLHLPAESLPGLEAHVTRSVTSLSYAA